MKEFIAHIRHIEQDFELQTICEHSLGTAKIAKEFARGFGSAEWGEWLGRAHDMGKFSSYFQQYIRVNSGMVEAEKMMSKEDHSSAGAIYALKSFPHIYPPLSYCIAGHHSGLLDWTSSGEANMAHRLSKRDLLGKIEQQNIDTLGLIQDESLFSAPALKNPKKEFHLWIRMLFSCLVDADYLDTENFMNPTLSEARGNYDTLADLKQRFDQYMFDLGSNAPLTTINQIRSVVLQQCLSNGTKIPGFYNLSLPTGGGKTLSSMAWALVHAIKYKKSRIIVAIPYTSIIAQTAEIFRKIFGKDNVVEHHSNIQNEEQLNYSNKLSTENWDAPIVVTTNVQLFESLYAAKPSKCRKLHNLCNSVVILDEAQIFPVEFLQPVLDILQGLRSDFKTSILFTTATQPVFDVKIGSGKAEFQGLSEPVQELISEETDLSIFRRVEIEWPKGNEITEYEDLVTSLIEFEQVLCIVNTRKEAQAIFKIMPEGTLHLSRLMCSAHIMKTITEIKRRLAAGEPVRVISTQLIEAGVDIDFPVVFRAFAGLDSIVQAAGRCNREGKLNKIGQLGKVIVFNTPNGVPQGLMRKGADALREMLAIDPNADFLSKEKIQQYFNLYYSKANTFDKPSVKDFLYKDVGQMKFMFASVADQFQLIDDKDSVTVLIGYDSGTDLIKEFKQKGPEKGLMRKLQQYSVSLHKYDFEKLKEAGQVASFFGSYILEDPSAYDLTGGLSLDNHWLNELLYI
ncbi:MAG: CRISPR-associated helicase Cas3' [Bacteroidales bacterium]